MSRLLVALIALSAVAYRADCGLKELFSTTSDNNIYEVLHKLALAKKSAIKFFTNTTTLGPVEKEVIFLCGHRNSPELRLTSLDEDDMRSKIDLSKPIVFITHGWLGNITSNRQRGLASDLISILDTNVCGVGWSNISFSNYINAMNKTVVVSGYMTLFIQRLNNLGIPPSSVSLVGHSLGAHISGQVGFNFKGQIKTIFGLDPAGPGFTLPSGGPLSFRLDKTDAEYVQMIVTSKNTLGPAVAEGHENFFPNGGSAPTPNCVVPVTSDAEFPEVLFCSHAHAITLFRLSINPPIEYLAQQCQSYEKYLIGQCKGNRMTRMGIYSLRLGGDFYLETSPRAPFTDSNSTISIGQFFA